MKPGVYVMLAPCYLSTRDDVCTISPGALKRYSRCTKATHEPLDHLRVTTSKGEVAEIKVETAAGLDYVRLPVHHFKRPMETKSQRNPHLVVQPKLVFRPMVPNDPEETMELPATSPACDASHILDLPALSAIEADEVAEQLEEHAAQDDPAGEDYQLAYYLHSKYGHCNMEYIRALQKLGHVKGLPAKIPNMKYECPLCRIASATKIPRGGLVDYTQVRKGTMVRADWIIINTESCRGFKTALIITECTTRRKWGFPTRNRSAPIEQMRYFVEHLRLQGYGVNELRVDEDGSLAKSTNFMELCVKELKMAVQTTGGYNSTNNGMAESPIKPIKRMMRVMLVGAALPDELWCYAFVWAINVMNHSYHRMIKDMPIVRWYDGNYEAHSKDMHIFGSKVYVITPGEHKKQLQTRSEKDPRDYIGLTVDEAELGDKHVDGYFIGNAGHSTVKLIWNPETRTVGRAHHCYIDEYGVRTLESEKLTPNAVLLQDLPSAIRDEQGVVDPTKIKLVSSNFEETNERVDPDQCVTISVKLPEKGVSFGLKFESDETYGFPILSKVTPTSPLRTQIPMDMQKNCWVLAINSKENGYVEPITAQFCHNEITKCQRRNQSTQIELTFCRKIKPLRTEIQTYRAMSDQANPIQPIVRHMGVEEPIVSHIVSLPIRPTAGKSIWDCLDGKQKAHWIAGLFHQFTKNARNHVLSAPIPAEDLPSDVKVYQSIMACRIKEKGTSLWKFETRHCLNGSRMEQGSDYDFSFSPTISYPALRIVIAHAASLCRRLSILDVTNCFQNDVIPAEERVYITCPPYYIQWFKMTYPNVPLKKASNGKYVLQTLNGMQGRKDAGRSWYLNLRRILEDFGFVANPAEPALFVYYQEEEAMIVVTSTDDFLVSHSNQSVFDRFTKHMQRFVPVTTQEGAKLKYLNIRIVQSDMGISIDQTHHIQTCIVEKWFPRAELIKTADTPYRTDSEYERQLLETMPATKEELTELEAKHGGKFNAIIGSFNHIFQATRFDIGFAVTRLAQFNVAPNRPAFEGCSRIARYLATHLHCPIFYPCLKLKMFQRIRFEPEPGKVMEHLIANLLQMFVDADHARDVRTRKSITSILVTLIGVVVDWQMGKQSCIAAHSTDAEIRAFFAAIMKNRYLRPICESLRICTRAPTIIWEDNQPAIDIMTAGSITSRVKHMAIPVQMINEDIQLGNAKPMKIPGVLNTSDIGTKPLPASSHHRHFRQGRGHRFYPDASTEHGKSMQVDMVNQRLTEFDAERINKIDPHRMSDGAAIYDNKEKSSDENKVILDDEKPTSK